MNENDAPMTEPRAQALLEHALSTTTKRGARH